ncbi:ATP-binding protein [Schinkia sp. CFF1]
MTTEILFTINDIESIGQVTKVDSYSVSVSVIDENKLEQVNVNGFVILYTSNPNIRLIGRIDRVLQSGVDYYITEDGQEEVFNNAEVYINVLGTLKGVGAGRQTATFNRSVETLPEISSRCFLLNSERLTSFTRLITNETINQGTPLILGSFTMANGAKAILDGNAFFQRHAMIVGSTGSGKSWTTATIIEQVAELQNANMIVFDLHSEYSPLDEHDNIKVFRIAGPGDLNDPDDDVIFLPYWLLGYEDMLALILDRTDENAPNQAMAFSNTVIEAKRQTLITEGLNEELETFTIDSPVPYDISFVIDELTRLNNERVINPGTNREINGPFNGKFSRFLPRLHSKRSDRRYGFLFNLNEEHLQTDYLSSLVSKLMRMADDESVGVKIIDFSEVPSDILPVVISLVARLVFQVQQWSAKEERHPIALVCDEAHLYLPSGQNADAAEARALSHFERIAKEGRKYGVSLLIISQRPSELNTTIMSQCNNVISLRLSNQSDKTAVCNLLPENLGGIQDMLPTLGIGEAIVVGDSCLLPSRIKIKEPVNKPNSNSVKFWDEWGEGGNQQNLDNAVRNLRRQTMEEIVNS